MRTAETTKQSTVSPRSKLIGAYYLLTIFTGAFILFFHGKLAFAADLCIGLFYLVVTAFLYAGSAAANKGNVRKENL
jgi:hypothetical protein